jgi:hypothetical protein
MGTYPVSPRADFLAWCQAHTLVFQSNAAAIGISAAQATTFKNLTTDTAAAANAQFIAKEAAKAATQTVNARFDDLAESAAEMVRSIRTFAENTGNPGVYAIAQIPPPAIPQPIPAPTQPTNLSATLEATSGDITLRWKATQPAGAAGTSYLIRRRLAGQTEFAFVGVVGGKKFVDDTLIAGPDSVAYTVQAQRSDAAGPVSEILTINFGRAPGGSLTITNTQTMKQAA